MTSKLNNFTDVLSDEIGDSQPLSLSFHEENQDNGLKENNENTFQTNRPIKGTGQYGQFRSVEEIDIKYRSVFTYPYFNLVQSNVIEDALYSDNSMVVCAPTGSGKTVIFEMAIVRLLMEMEDKKITGDFKIIYMAPVKALCTERLSEWYPKFTKLGLLCIEVTGDTDVDFNQLSPYRIIITTPEKWDMLTRRWRDHRQLVEVIKLFLIDEVHILNDEVRGPVLEAVVSRMKTIESSAQSVHRIEQLHRQYKGEILNKESPPNIRFVAVSATVGNPEDVAKWLGTDNQPAVFHTFGDECRPVKLKRVVEGYACPEGASIFKFDIILSYKIWPIIQKYHNGKPTLIFCNTRKSVILTAETLSREITITFNPEQKAKLTALASTMKNKKLQSLILSGVGCHHAGLLFEERTNIELAFRNRDLPILITTTTLAMGVNLPAHLVIIKNTQQYVNGAYQEYSISTILQMVGRAGRPQFDTEATAVIMTRLCDKPRYQALVGGSEPLQSYLHKRLPENLNSEAALGTVSDVAQCVQWLRSTFLFVRAARDPRRYLGLPQTAPQQQISKKIEELCVKAMNGLASSGLITMDEASCIESTEAGRLMSIFYLDLETMKHIMKVNGNETLDQLLWIVCESHELSDMHLRVDERRYLNALNRNQSAATIRFPMKGKITTRQMKLYCIIQAVLGCLPISDPSLNQEAMKIMRIADRVCKCLLAYVTIPNQISANPKYYSAILNSVILAKCVAAHLWENSPYVSRQLKGIGPTFSTLLATAGKVNFMLLEESHPRDLERIMNKGPPAGNVLRKQVSLLPKYQLTMTPIDQKTVSIQIDLLNCNYLLENIEQLTAGSAHKCYVIVGDSENHVLLVTSFNDNNFINVYNGCLKYEITRIHSFEHKVFAHCISSTFAGIDVHSEYTFTSLEPFTRPPNEEKSKTTVQNQTTITDTFKERKRKNNSDEITQSKEKKKRDSLLIEKFKNLKESFGRTSNEIKYELHKTAKLSNDILQNINQSNEPVKNISENNFTEKKNLESNSKTHSIEISNIDDMFTDEMADEDLQDEFMNDDKINDILTEIENEISRRPQTNTKSIASLNNTVTKKRLNEYTLNPKTSGPISLNRKRTLKTLKSNYNFIDLLEKNIDFSDEPEGENVTNTGFSENIKENINDFLCKLQPKSTLPDTLISKLMDTPKAAKETMNKESQKIKDNFTDELPINETEASENDEVIENTPKYDNKVSTCDEKSSINTILCNKDKEILIRNEVPNVNNTKELELPEVIFTNKKSDNSITNEEDSKKHDTNKNIIPNKYSEENTELSLALFDRHSNIQLYSNNPVASTTDTKHEVFLIEKESDHIDIIDILPQVLPNICDTYVRDYDIIPSFNNHLQINQINDHIHKESNQTPSHSVIENINSAPNTFYDNNHFKKYSYSTTKIDVITKEKSDHILHVIRKMKIDLDVTEIPKLNKTNDVYMENFNTSCSGIKSITVNTITNDLALTNGNVIEPKFALRGIEKETESFKPNLVTTAVNTDVPTLIEGVDDQNIDKLSCSKGTEIEKSCNKNENTKLSRYEDIINSKNLKEETSDKKKSISSILEKYCEKIRTQYTEEKQTLDSPKTKTLTQENNKSNSGRRNTKRPFSIRDIERINQIKLPKQIIVPSSQNKVVQRNVRRNEDTTPPIILNVPNMSEFEDTLKLESIEETFVNEVETEIPNINEIIETCEYNIDQSMFDPKQLLKCFNNEDLTIVPPPPEFSDFLDPQNDASNLENIIPDIVERNEINTPSLIEDDYHVILTPSKEIEVWNLSQQSSPISNTFSSAPKYIKTDYSILSLPSGSGTGYNSSRKLKEFEFINKSKLKRKL